MVSFGGKIYGVPFVGDEMIRRLQLDGSPAFVEVTDMNGDEQFHLPVSSLIVIDECSALLDLEIQQDGAELNQSMFH